MPKWSFFGASLMPRNACDHACAPRSIQPANVPVEHIHQAGVAHPGLAFAGDADREVVLGRATELSAGEADPE